MCSGDVVGTVDLVRGGSVRGRITGLGQHPEGHRYSYFLKTVFKLILIYFKPSTQQLREGSSKGFHQ